jgi:hypothetical protein
VLHVLPGVVVFALGLAITDAPLTATAMNSVPAQHSGIASAVNNDAARVGGLLAIAVLPPLAGITGPGYLHPAALAAGFRTAVLIAGATCAAGGLLAALTITDPPRVPRPPSAPPPAECLHCGLDAPPLRTNVGNQSAPDDHPPVPGAQANRSRICAVAPRRRASAAPPHGGLLASRSERQLSRQVIAPGAIGRKHR